MSQPSTPTRRQFCQLGALGLAASCTPAWANTDAFPSKPIKLIVPFPPGGLTDALARNLGASVSTQLGQPVIVDNRPGVGGTIGAELVAKSPADGHTLLLTLSSLLPSASVLYTKLRFNPEKDLICVSESAMLGGAWVVNSSLPVNNVRELVEYSKANPDKVSMASLGAGTPNHVSLTLLNNEYGAKLLHVPYKGEGPMVQDLLGGQINASIVAGIHVQAHKASGKLRCIGVQGSRRSPMLPDVPLLSEQGFKQESWSREGPMAIFAPKGLPPAVLSRLGEAFKVAAATPKVVQYLQEGGIYPHGNLPAEAQANFERYYAIVKRSTAATGVVLD
ncbi:Bug family tripartite tricarboxylate transporter substrate binding protein [Comamonas serinivorans]|nr:tripartite tricarboxylate transporter substrate binding protein [Comamonas serinivorans]